MKRYRNNNLPETISNRKRNDIRKWVRQQQGGGKMERETEKSGIADNEDVTTMGRRREQEKEEQADRK